MYQQLTFEDNMEPNKSPNPIGSMYGIFTYIWLMFMVNVGKYTLHGSYGNWKKKIIFPTFIWLVVEPTHLKNMLVKMGSSSPNRGENKKYLKPPPSHDCVPSYSSHIPSQSLTTKGPWKMMGLEDDPASYWVSAKLSGSFVLRNTSGRVTSWSPSHLANGSLK